MTKLEMYCGDARELAEQKIAAGTVDLIFTDPPYEQAYLWSYEWLADEAVRVLKPDGFIIAYSGGYWKDVAMRSLGAKLQFFYDFVLVHKGNTTILWPRKVITGYKSLLCFHRKGATPLPRTNVLGQYNGLGGDKRFHAWGQEEGSARYYIDCFTNEGDLVVDYFLGGGTIVEVCKRLNRQFIGFEIDPATFEIARARVDGGFGPGEKGRQGELTECP